MKRMLILAIMLAFLALPAWGNQAGMSWTQQYRLLGFKVYDNQYVRPGVDVDIGGLNVSAIEHLRDWNDDWDNLDARINYKLPLDGLYIRPGYGYLKLPSMDYQDASLTVGLNGSVSPRYTLDYVIPESGDNGQVHTFGVDVDLGKITDTITAGGSVNVTYNDGVNPLGGKAVSDWTHATAGLQLQVPIGNFILQPGVVYQYTFEPDILNTKENEVWATVSLGYSF